MRGRRAASTQAIVAERRRPLKPALQASEADYEDEDDDEGDSALA
jgi:hypothetical protein